MSRSHVTVDRAPSARSAPRRRLARPLVALLGTLALGAAGCGDGNSGTGPGTGGGAESVSGRYRAVRSLTAITCTPQRPPAGGGTVVLDAFADTVVMRLTQSGNKVTATYPDIQGATPDTGSVDASGSVRLGSKETFQEAPRGTRTFFVNLTTTEDFHRTGNPAILAGSGIYVNVFHEGSATAPKFADCYRSGTTELLRIGDS